MAQTSLIVIPEKAGIQEIRGYFTDYLSRSEKAKDAINLALEKLEIIQRTRKGHQGEMS